MGTKIVEMDGKSNVWLNKVGSNFVYRIKIRLTKGPSVIQSNNGIHWMTSSIYGKMTTLPNVNPAAFASDVSSRKEIWFDIHRYLYDNLSERKDQWTCLPFKESTAIGVFFTETIDWLMIAKMTDDHKWLVDRITRVELAV